MKIRLISYQGIKLSICIERKYLYKNPIISLGCDCHPAYVLKYLNLRIHSFPFDWVNTTPFQGIDYVNNNVKNGFKNFLQCLVNNERGYVVSSHFKETEFFHYPELIDNQDLRAKLYRRAERFLDFFNNNKCFFLFNITSEGLNSRHDADHFLRSVNEFHRLSNGNHVLLIYIRYDESFYENELHCNWVEKRLRDISNTRTVKYIRQKSVHGIWGDEKQYTKLLEEMGIKLRIGFPRIYLSKTYKKVT